MILKRDELLTEIEDKRDKIIVTTNGVFDIIHPGHIKCLEKAKKLGDILIVGVNSDESVKKNKGPNRPINPQIDRAIVIDSLKCVDYVTIFDEETPIDLLRLIRPDIHTKGGDYSIEKILEKDIIEKHGGRIKILSHDYKRSTTDIIEKILKIQQ